MLALWVPPKPAAAQGDAHYSAGVAAFNAGDYKKAVSEMTASLAASPTANAALYLGNAHLKLGQLDAAKAALLRVLQIEPNTPKRGAIQELIKGIDAARRAAVTVTSTPPGATVYLESVSAANARGKTPVTLQLTAGRHEIIVVLEGHVESRRTAQVKPKDKLDLAFELSTKGCPLEISGEPAATKASIDNGEPVALPFKSRVGIGEHKVAFSAEGFTPKEVNVTCDAEKPLVATATLERITGRLKIGAAQGVTVTVDGRALSAEELASGIALAPGTHEVVFSGGGRPTTKKTIEVAAAAEVTVDAPPVEAAPPPPPPPPPATPPPPPPTAYPKLALYAGLTGGAHLTLVEWSLGDTNGRYPTSSAMAGGRIGLQLVPRFAVEGEVQWVGLPNRADDGLGHGLVTDANALFHVLSTRWTPVIEAGVGTYQVLSSKLGADSDLRLHAGLGVRGRVGDRWVLRLDVRNVVTDGFDNSIGDNLEILLGVDAFLFGKK